MNASSPEPVQSSGARAAGRRSLAGALAGLVALVAAGSVPAAEESWVI